MNAKFFKYALVGFFNTLIHWIIFIVLFYSGQPQSMSNFVGFCVAVTFSFFANAKWTFNSEATTARYLLYVFFIGSLASIFGWYADSRDINPIFTLIAFSSISLLIGFLYSKFIVFKVSRAQ
nr:GtrA family protein [Rosenbergiella australiborealis]